MADRANLIFCLSSKISGRLWNLPGSPGDIIHVEQGIDDKKQVPEEKDIQFNSLASHRWDGAEVYREREKTPELLKEFPLNTTEHTGSSQPADEGKQQ